MTVVLDTFKELLANQFEAALCTLNACIDRCPETAWDSPVANLAFCQVVFHTLFFADVYLGQSEHGYREQPFHRDNARFFRDYEEMEDRKQELLYDRATIKAYLEHCRNKASKVIAAETERMIEGWGERGTFDALDFFSELTIYTSSACLIGREFRDELGPEYVPIFKDLERGTDAFAYVNANLPLPTFRRRDRARRELVTRIEEIFARRKQSGKEYSDLLQILHQLRDGEGRRRYTDDQITGMFISMMFAGHHTSSVVASWALLDLLMHPEWLAKVVAGLDEIYADGRDVSYQALREIPLLEAALKETLRLHPPLIILMRKAMRDFHFDGWTIPVGRTVAVSTAVSNRDPDHFPEPERYAPERYLGDRDEGKQSFAWVPFGAGRHRCVGAAFAMMQLKAIFSILLRRYEFVLTQPATSYGNDLSKMVVAVRQPCGIGYRLRAETRAADGPVVATRERTAAGRSFAVGVDLDLCQGHGVCVGEAPKIFDLDKSEMKVRIRNENPGAADRAAVESAVRFCPTGALQIIEPDETENRTEEAPR